MSAPYARYALALCETCDGCGETESESHRMDCPDCLGTGYAEPEKRILNLMSELSEMRYSRDEWSKECETNMALLKLALEAGDQAIRQRDTLVEALETVLDEVRNDYMACKDEVKAALASVKGGSHE
jgi:hypothetical protein